MKKNSFFVVGKLAAVLLLGVTVVGCTTTQHSIEISNIPRASINEVYIKNAGTTNWGYNIAANLNNIDITRYSQRVDIKVVARGIVYSKYNVPFDESAFVKTSTSSINTFALLGIAGAGLGGYYLVNQLIGK